MKKGTTYRKVVEKPATSISPEARKLILATLKRYKGSQSAAANALRLPVRSQLGRMLRGEMRETPAMRAAVIRAKARSADAAKRAFIMDSSKATTVEVEQVKKKVEEMMCLLEIVQRLLS